MHNSIIYLIARPTALNKHVTSGRQITQIIGVFLNSLSKSRNTFTQVFVDSKFYLSKNINVLSKVKVHVPYDILVFECLGAFGP